MSLISAGPDVPADRLQRRVLLGQDKEQTTPSLNLAKVLEEIGSPTRRLRNAISALVNGSRSRLGRDRIYRFSISQK